MTLLRISTPEIEGIYQGSRWLKFQVLCCGEELQDLFNRLGSLFIFPLTGIVNGSPLSIEFFLNEYQGWIHDLMQKKMPEERSLKKILAAAMTNDLEALWLQKIPDKGYLVKIAKPVLQVQAHWLTYSDADGVFRSMSMGARSIFWGLQFAYPGVYQDAKTMELKETASCALLEIMREWVRDQTRPTPFLVGGKRINSPIRLGKKCFSWIGSHPQLVEQGISIHGC
ncbi:MAG TPA: hypothetical protein VLE95_06305 [Chlamydiales bacterium]|nr:hypothetical protein [Chlamydiales bacterium]